MLVMSKRNIIIPSMDGTAQCRLFRGDIKEIPSWVSKTKYYKELVKDGKIIPVSSKKDKDLQEDEEKQVIDHTRDNDTTDNNEDSETEKQTEDNNEDSKNSKK